MKYIKVEERLKNAGKDPDGNILYLNTTHLIISIVRASKAFNTGRNILLADKIAKACADTDRNQKRYMTLEDTDYNLLKSEIDTVEWSSLYGQGAMLWVPDIKNIDSAVDTEPEDYNEAYVGIKA